MLEIWMHFARLYWLVAIPLLILLYSGARLYQKKRTARFSPGFARPASTLRRMVCLCLVLSAIALLIMAWARPRWGKKQQDKDTGINIVIAIDISRSMLVQDGENGRNRLQIARELVKAILELTQDKVGLIVFSQKATIVCPCTSDRDALHLMIQELQADVGITCLSSPMELGKKMFEGLEPGKNKVLMLITDGGDSSETLSVSDPKVKKMVEIENKKALGMADSLAEKKIFCLWVGLGQETGRSVPMGNGNGHVEWKGQKVLSKVNKPFLEKISHAGQGILIPFTQSTDSLPAILASLDRIRTDGKAQDPWEGLQDQFYWFVIPAMGLLFLEIFLAHKSV